MFYYVRVYAISSLPTKKGGATMSDPIYNDEYLDKLGIIRVPELKESTFPEFDSKLLIEKPLSRELTKSSFSTLPISSYQFAKTDDNQSCDDDYEEDWEDRMPSVGSVALLVASFFCPFLLPVSAWVIANDAQKRTQRSKAKKIARKFQSPDTALLQSLGKKKKDLNGARLTHTFTVDEKLEPTLVRSYNTGIITEEIDYETGTIKRKIDID